MSAISTAATHAPCGGAPRRTAFGVDLASELGLKHRAARPLETALKLRIGATDSGVSSGYVESAYALRRTGSSSVSCASSRRACSLWELSRRSRPTRAAGCLRGRSRAAVCARGGSPRRNAVLDAERVVERHRLIAGAPLAVRSASVGLNSREAKTPRIRRATRSTFRALFEVGLSIRSGGLRRTVSHTASSCSCAPNSRARSRGSDPKRRPSPAPARRRIGGAFGRRRGERARARAGAPRASPRPRQNAGAR